MLLSSTRFQHSSFQQMPNDPGVTKQELPTSLAIYGRETWATSSLPVAWAQALRQWYPRDTRGIDSHRNSSTPATFNFLSLHGALLKGQVISKCSFSCKPNKKADFLVHKSESLDFQRVPFPDGWSHHSPFRLFQQRMNSHAEGGDVLSFHWLKKHQKATLSKRPLESTTQYTYTIRHLLPTSKTV